MKEKKENKIVFTRRLLGERANVTFVGFLFFPFGDRVLLETKCYIELS